MSKLSLSADPKNEENTNKKEPNQKYINNCFSLLPELEECDLNIISQPKSLNDKLPLEEFIFTQDISVQNYPLNTLFSFQQYAEESCMSTNYNLYNFNNHYSHDLVKCTNCEEMINSIDQYENCYYCFKKEQHARENYMMARNSGTYEYYRFCRDLPDELEQQVNCPNCAEMMYIDDQNGMCYSCFTTEQRLYPDDIPMDLRYSK